MFKFDQSGGVLRRFHRREWLCLLIAVTFLYNPFLAASVSTSGLAVCHMPSFRATAAHSELLKFAPKENSETLVVPECGLVRPANLPASQTSSSRRHFDVGEKFPRYFEVGNLWFRPPPAIA